MRVALEEPAGLGLGVLWTLKVLAEWTFLVVGPGGARVFRSYLSMHCQLCGVSDMARDKQSLG